MDRLDAQVRFYEILAELEENLGGKKRLADCDGRMGWPKRGVYFFFEDGEERTDSGMGQRVVRVGTHALSDGSKATLWNRLSQHRGSGSTYTGNHRGSIFRLLIGAAIKNRESLAELGSWGISSDPAKAAQKLGLTRSQVKEQEHDLEVTVSKHIRSMGFLWVAVDDPPGPTSSRGVIERNSIGLLSNYRYEPLDPPSSGWLGRHSDRERVQHSGVWNNRHVEEGYEPEFLELLASFGEDTPPLS